MNEEVKIVFCALAICLAGSSAPAQVNLSIVKNQAHRAAGGTPAAGSQTPAMPPPSSVDPALATTLKNIGNLQADFAVITAAADAESAMSQRISLLNHLSSAAQGTKASSANIRQLAGNLINALAGHKQAGEPERKLAQSVHALFNSAHLSTEQQVSLLTEVKKVLTDADVSADAADKVTDNLKAIAAETK